MEKKTINPKIRTAFIAIFALAIVLSTTSLIMQLPFQSANAKNYFEDPDTGDMYSCNDKYDRAIFVDSDVICLD
jgi:hypothetical protein